MISNTNKPATNLEDELSQLDPPYRLRQEAENGRMLDRYGIPFFYDQPAMVFDRGQYEAIRPAFTLPGYGGLVLEYVENEAQIGLRKQLYDSNGIPSVIINQRELSGFRGPANLFNRIERAIQQYKTLMQDPAMSEVQPSDYIHLVSYQ